MNHKDEWEGWEMPRNGAEIPFFPHNGDRDKSFYAASDWAWSNVPLLGVFYHITDTGEGWKIEIP